MRSDITILRIARGARPARATIRERWEISSERLRILVTAPNRVRQARCCGALLLRKAISSCAAVAVCGRRPRPHGYGAAVAAAVSSRRGNFWIGRAHVLTPVPKAPIVCHFLYEK